MSANLELNVQQIKDLINQLDPEEQQNLRDDFLKEEARAIFLRFKEIGRELPFTFEDITKEVEAVRSERYS